MIRQAQRSDLPAAAALAALLFKGSAPEELSRELEAVLDSGAGAVFLLSKDVAAVGFAQ